MKEATGRAAFAAMGPCKLNSLVVVLSIWHAYHELHNQAGARQHWQLSGSRRLLLAKRRGQLGMSGNNLQRTDFVRHMLSWYVAVAIKPSATICNHVSRALQNCSK